MPSKGGCRRQGGLLAYGRLSVRAQHCCVPCVGDVAVSAQKSTEARLFFLPTFGSDSALCYRSVSRLSSEVPSLPSPGGTVCPVAQVGFGCSGLLRCDEESNRTAGGHGELCQREAPLQPGGTATVKGHSLQAEAEAPHAVRGLPGSVPSGRPAPSPLPPKKARYPGALHSAPRVSGPGSAPGDGAERSCSEPLPPASVPVS